ncbi:dihydroneopterin aldolase [Campylobacter sp.]|uniref:dihydroneopterin aldolase n=1 Tax=Campylobacter sp. TaxID=205 RepID=UPI0026DDC430|nr:dihydroneopterin aldolase [Campylobacter sp.]MDO4674085.1 dihydroneopterin aldolase [Campylobacter sp.]
MQSHIKIKLKFKCIIGILDFERKKKQTVIVKIKAKANDFLDYAKVAKRVKKIYKKHKFQTIEESLRSSSQKLKQHFPQIYYLKITTLKPQIIKNAEVGASVKNFFNFF